MAKTKQIGRSKVYQIFCQGCNCTHNINCNPDAHGAWTYTNSQAGPNFKPSVKILHGEKICEFSITSGLISYTKNTTHKFAGKTIELTEIKNTL